MPDKIITNRRVNIPLRRNLRRQAEGKDVGKAVRNAVAMVTGAGVASRLPVPLPVKAAMIGASLASGAKAPVNKTMVARRLGGKAGEFVPTAKLDPSQVSDRRGVLGPVDLRNPLVIRRPSPPTPQRSGTSSNTSGPNPNARAVERANARARFKRT